MIDRQLNYGRHHFDKFLSLAVPYSKVLDLGAGQGDDLITARKYDPSAALYALESYPPYIKNLEAQGISVFSANIERDPIPFDDESVDIVIMNQILEHVKEVFWIMHEVTRVLKVGGKFMVGMPNLASLHNRLLLAIGRQPSSIQNDSAHVRGYTKGDFLKVVNSGFADGYTLENAGGANFYPFPPVLAKPLAALLPNMAYGMCLNLEKNRPYNDKGYLRFPVEKQLESNFFVG